MLEKKIGEPCPTCETPLQRRRSTFRTIVGDVAYCAARRFRLDFSPKPWWFPGR